MSDFTKAVAVAKGFAKKAVTESEAYADELFEAVKDGLKYQGSVATEEDLPTPSTSIKGHFYTVLENGHEWLCDGTEWVDLSADLDNKVDKEGGKGLSANDFTDEDKAKVHTHSNKDVLDEITLANKLEIVALSDGTETLAELNERLNGEGGINPQGRHVFFDTSAISPNILYLCTIFIDDYENPTEYRVHDNVTGMTSVGNYEASKTLSQILSEAVKDLVTITVTCTATDGVTVTGNTITLRSGATKDAPVIGTRTYAGQPVTFIVAKDAAYYVQASNFTGHFPVDDVKGVANTDTSILFSFRDYGEVETFADVQTLCRAGVVQDALEIGQTFDMVKDGVTYPVAVMHFIENGKSGSIKLKNGLQEGVIFQTVDCPYSTQFDSAEAFHTTTVEYSAGTTLNFTIPSAYSSWAAGTYQFTLTQDAPVGTQFCFSGNAGTALTSLFVRVYASAESTTLIEECAITEGNDGTALGNLNGATNNHPQRVSYGNNRWIHSALRQQLNSDAIAGSVWTPQHKWDRPPSWNTSLKGFLNGLSSDVADYIAEVEVDTYRNTVTDGGGLDTSTEKVFLVGRVEEWFPVEGSDNGVAWDYYKDGSVSNVPHNGADAIRGKKTTGASANTYWWQRSPYVGYAHNVRIAYPDGSSNNDNASNSYGVSPAFVIA